jgi:hypothetical protein
MTTMAGPVVATATDLIGTISVIGVAIGIVISTAVEVWIATHAAEGAVLGTLCLIKSSST